MLSWLVVLCSGWCYVAGSRKAALSGGWSWMLGNVEWNVIFGGVE